MTREDIVKEAEKVILQELQDNEEYRKKWITSIARSIRHRMPIYTPDPTENIASIPYGTMGVVLSDRQSIEVIKEIGIGTIEDIIKSKWENYGDGRKPSNRLFS